VKVRCGTWWLLVALLLTARTIALEAHAGSVAFWRVTFDTREARSEILLSLDDVALLAPDVGGEAGPVPVARLGALADAILRHLVVVDGGTAAPATIVGARVLPSGLLELQVRHRVAEAGSPLALRATFHQLTDDTHRVIARVERAGGSTSATLREAAPLVFDVATTERALTSARGTSSHEAAAPARSAWAMFLVGIGHIFMGYDHLVFLACLLVPGGTWRSRVAMVSAFTAAHSATLVLAALGIVTMPPQFVEPAIAVSIAYVAAENLLGGPRSARWPTAFGFGLIHGFGFAGLLEQLDLPAGQWATSVLAFNLGVEAGQLVIVAVALPVIIVLARSPWHRRVVQCTSVIVFGFAVAWFIERLP
jgi:hydrogenase/urease accessory protein HupE